MRILHFSDPHVQLPGWRRRKLHELGPLRALATVELWKGRGALYDDALDKLRAIVRDADALRADHVICTGDLTQLAHEEEFALAAEALAPIRARLTVIPGNHDRYPLAGKPNRLFERYFGEAPREVRLGDLRVVTTDSAGEVSWPVVSRGRVAEPPRDVAGALVLVHHAPVRANARPDFVFHALAGAAAFLAATRDAAAVLCGHIHERYDVTPRDGARVVCAGSSTMRGREGYFVIETDGPRLLSVEPRTVSTNSRTL